MRTLALPLLLALATPAVAGKDPFAFFADGAGAVQVEGDGRIPLLRGIDTDGKPSVLARGPKPEDEFLLRVKMLGGGNLCTEAVVEALGGEIEEYTLGSTKKGGAFSTTIKKVTKGATIPEVTLEGEDGKVVLQDLHCEIHTSENVLSVVTLDEVAVAALASEGVYRFAPADQADDVLGDVGDPVEAVRGRGLAAFDEGTLTAKVGVTFVFDGTLFGKPAKVIVEDDGGPTRISGPQVEPAVVGQRGGHRTAIGAVAVGGVTLSDRAVFSIWDDTVGTIYGDSPEEDILVDAVVGHGVFADVDIAVDPSTGRAAFKKLDAAAWSDPTDKFLEDAKEAFDKAGGDADDSASDGDSARLLVPVAPTVLASAEAPRFCDQVQLKDTSYQSIDGVRAFGAAAQHVEANARCPDGVYRAEESDGEEATAGDSGAPTPEASGTAEGGTDKKEAKRLADYGDALWKHGRFDEALDLYDRARGLAGDDCSYHEDFAKKALAMGRTDDAIAAAQRSAELYEPWAAQDIEVRIAVQNNDDDVPPGTITTPQPHDCHRARGYQAAGYLVKGAHTRIEKLHDAHMDLDENLALALSLSRLQRGQAKRSRGPALQALNVGARGTVSGHRVHGVVASRWGSERLLQANLERLLILGKPLGAGDYLVGVAMARQSSDEDAVRTWLDRAVTERPDEPGAWTAHALEARRRGDSGALARTREKAAEIARDAVDVSGGLARAWCEGASLLYAVGDTAAGDTYRGKARGQARPGESCLVADVVKQVAAGDAQATANALHALAVRIPMNPLGTLELVSALPGDGAE